MAYITISKDIVKNELGDELTMQVVDNDLPEGPAVQDDTYYVFKNGEAVSLESALIELGLIEPEEPSAPSV